MQILLRYFSWIVYPQLFVGFLVLCLTLNGVGHILQASFTIEPGMRVPSTQQMVPPDPPRTDCSTQPCLAITFDDGPHPVETPHVLDILARHQVAATFFLVGVHVPGNEAILQRMHQEGHEIGNHTWNHPDLSTLTPEQVHEQLESTQKVIAGAGVPVPRLLRPPYGAVNDMVAAHNKLSIIRWNVDPEDWHSKNPAEIQTQMLTNVRPGAILLLHDIHPETAAALDPALETLKQRFRLVTVSELLKLSPGDQGQFFAQ